MKKIILFLILANIGFYSISYSQNNEIMPFGEIKDVLGIGYGLDYGGFGLQYTRYVEKNVGLFGAIGYTNTADVPYNIGAKIRYIYSKSTAKSSPFLLGMYGYHRGMIYKNLKWDSSLQYGFTIGAGVDYRTSLVKQNFLSFAIFYPLIKNETVQDKNKFPPIEISLGFKVNLNKYIKVKKTNTENN